MTTSDKHTIHCWNCGSENVAQVDNLEDDLFLSTSCRCRDCGRNWIRIPTPQLMERGKMERQETSEA